MKHFETIRNLNYYLVTMDDIVLTHATLDVGKISRSVPIPYLNNFAAAMNILAL